MLTLKDIAELSKVSISTVSRVLSNSTRISAETRERVLRAITELSYRPGHVTQKVAGRARTIGVFVPESQEFMDDDPSTSLEINRLRKELEQGGNRVVIIKNRGTVTEDSVAMRLLEKRALDGAVISDPFFRDGLIGELKRRGVPFVVTNGRFPDADHNFVDYNNRHGAAEMMRYLLSLGHRRIGVLCGPPDHLVSRNRRLGCEDAIREQGHRADVIWQPAAFSVEGGLDGMNRLLRRGFRPTAVFAFSDNIAFGAMRAIREAGLRIPRDVSLGGFDDMALSQCVDPPLTTVKHYRFDITGLIVNALRSIFDVPTIEKVQISLRTELVVRQSCRRLRGGR